MLDGWNYNDDYGDYRNTRMAHTLPILLLHHNSPDMDIRGKTDTREKTPTHSTSAFEQIKNFFIVLMLMLPPR